MAPFGSHGAPTFEPGDRVKVTDGTFVGMVGTVECVLERWRLVRIELRLFDKPVPVELEYWQVEAV